MDHPEIITTSGLIEEILEKWRYKIGNDYAAIRGHVYRMFNFCVALSGRSDPGTVKKIAIAAAFHDIGIWTHDTFDYLPPSCDLAMAYLKESDNAAWSRQLSEMIILHHKLTPCRGEQAQLAEAFRRADLVDLSLGFVRSGLDRAFVREVQAALPNAGFHARVTRFSLAWAIRHPLNPVPFIRRQVR